MINISNIICKKKKNCNKNGITYIVYKVEKKYNHTVNKINNHMGEIGTSLQPEIGKER